MSAAEHIGLWLRLPVASGLALVLATGCAGSAPPAETAPELSARLSSVDRAIADRRFGEARRRIEGLVRATVAAREAGELEPEQAEPILVAAASLVSALPRQPRLQQSPSPTPQPEPDADEGEQPTEPDDGTGNGEEEAEKRQEEIEKRREELQKKREEEQKKLEEEQKKEEGGNGEEGGGEGSGNGGNGEKGHDD